MAENVYSLIINFSVGGQFAQCVQHWKFDDSNFTTTKSAAEALQAAWITAARNNTLRNMLSSQVTITSLRGACVSAVGGFEAFTPLSVNNVGTRGSAMSASGLSIVFFYVPVNLTFPRGRQFYPGLAELDVEDGIYTASFRTVAQANGPALVANLTLSGGGGPTAVFGIWKKKAKVFYLTTNTLLSEIVGTQRGRMRPV